MTSSKHVIYGVAGKLSKHVTRVSFLTGCGRTKKSCTKMHAIKHIKETTFEQPCCICSLAKIQADVKPCLDETMTEVGSDGV